MRLMHIHIWVMIKVGRARGKQWVIMQRGSYQGKERDRDGWI